MVGFYLEAADYHYVHLMIRLFEFLHLYMNIYLEMNCRQKKAHGGGAVG